jgi:hypothetical protein
MHRARILFSVVALLGLLVLAFGCEREVVNGGGDGNEFASCFTCHGEDGFLIAAEGEWRNSIHASGNNVDYTNRGGFDCTKCHDHQGFLDFLDDGQINPPYDQVSAIHCFTCHSPHERGNLTLRIDDPYVLENGDSFDHGPANLCANCHHASMSADDITDDQEITSSHWGTHHGPQADLLNGSNGYEFVDYNYGNTGHGNIFGNSGCIGCHMGQPRTHVGYKIGGHSFNMVDEESGATLVGVCEECHPDIEDYDYEGIQTEVMTLLEDLEVLLFAEGVIDDEGHPVVGTIPDESVAGALYNFIMVEEDRSHGVHNPEYIVDLLESSITYMENLGGGLARIAVTPLPAH